VSLRLELGQFDGQSFELTTEWREYSFEVTPDPDVSGTGLSLLLETPGTAWLNLLRVVPGQGAVAAHAISLHATSASAWGVAVRPSDVSHLPGVLDGLVVVVAAETVADVAQMHVDRVV